MRVGRVLLVVLIGLVGVVMASSAERVESTPTIKISANKVPTHSHIEMKGSGFTPKGNATSHLRTPDGKEYPVLPMLADAHGELTHEIDTLLLAIGTHELWVVDDVTKTSSNRVQFEVTR